MEEKKLDAADSLALISNMIENTRNRMVRNSGRPFIIWGYSTVVTTLIVICAVLYTQNPYWNYLWFLLPVSGLILTYATRPKTSEGKVYTFIDRVITMTWVVMGAAGWYMSLLSILTPMWSRMPILFIIVLMMGLGTAITGLIIRFTPVIVGGFVAIAIAPGLLLASGLWVPVLFMAVFVVMMIIPGHILNYKSNHPNK